MTANPFDLIGAEIDVSDGSLALIVSDQEVGEWPLHRLAIDSAIDGFHVKVDGEEFIFSTREADAFAAAVGISLFGSRRLKQGKSAKAVAAIKSSGLVQVPAKAQSPAPRPKASRTRPPARPPAPGPAAVQAKPHTAGKPSANAASPRVESAFAPKEFFGTRRLIGIALVIGVVALAIVARPLMAGILLLLGFAAALLAGAAAVDPLLSTRLPESWPPGRLAISAVAMLVIGMMLVAF